MRAVSGYGDTLRPGTSAVCWQVPRGGVPGPARVVQSRVRGDMRRLFEDPTQARALRDDLQRSKAAGHDYPVADKLMPLKAALADPTRQAVESGSVLVETRGAWRWRTLHPGWKLAALLAVSGSAVVLTQLSRVEPAQRSTAQGPQVATSHAPLEPHEPSPNAAPSEPAQVVGTDAAQPSAEAASSSRREIAQLVRIRALLQHDPAAAYRLALRSEREFRDGLLSEERRALAVVALHRLGAHEQAERKAREFFARFPNSPMRGTIEAELGWEHR